MNDLTWHFRGRYLGLVERGRWEYATRTNATGVVVLVPLTASGELVLVEQFRVPVGRAVLELPAGLAGDLAENDETLESAARRELLEETGYRAGRLELLLACPSSAGLTDEIIHIYLAQDLEREHTGGGDASENILVHHLPLADAEAWLQVQAARGLLLDPKIFAALYWLRDLPARTGGGDQP